MLRRLICQFQAKKWSMDGKRRKKAGKKTQLTLSPVEGIKN